MKQTYQTLTGDALREARGWVADFVWADLDDESFDELTDAEITRGIARHYDGGLPAFLASFDSF